jgi:hypothetical protein
MGSNLLKDDEKHAAKLLWQLKAIATKEVARLPVHCIDSFFFQNSSSEDSTGSEESESSSDDTRGRTVSVGSVDMVSSSVTPVLSFRPIKVSQLLDTKPFLLDDDGDDVGSNSTSFEGRTPNSRRITKNIIDHHDWSNHLVNPGTPIRKYPTSTSSQQQQHQQHPLLCSPKDIIKQCKKKRESYVGRTTNSGVVRATLRKKVNKKSNQELGPRVSFGVVV